MTTFLRLAVSGPDGRALIWRSLKLRLVLAAFAAVVVALPELEDARPGAEGALTAQPLG